MQEFPVIAIGDYAFILAFIWIPRPPAVLQVGLEEDEPAAAGLPVGIAPLHEGTELPGGAAGGTVAADGDRDALGLGQGRFRCRGARMVARRRRAGDLRATGAQRSAGLGMATAPLFATCV